MNAIFVIGIDPELAVERTAAEDFSLGADLGEGFARVVGAEDSVDVGVVESSAAVGSIGEGGVNDSWIGGSDGERDSADALGR